MGLANPFAKALGAHDTDIFVYSGPLSRADVKEVLDERALAIDAKHCLLVLSTPGGDADAAYLIARAFKRRYDDFRLFVPGLCKSAGTLIALGADEIIMGERGELGPLDVQLAKDDDLFRRNSGLDLLRAIPFLVSSTFEAFEQCFLQLVSRSGGSITTHTAAEIATNLAAELFSPVTGQLDPQKIGETQRAIEIAMEYAVRLGANHELAARLVHDYPSHGFVIDFEEAEKLFPKVRLATPAECALADLVDDVVGGVYVPHRQTLCMCLTRKNMEIDPENRDNEQADTQEAEVEGGQTAEHRSGGKRDEDAGERDTSSPEDNANGAAELRPSGRNRKKSVQAGEGI